jgi:hypothetical protein
LKCVDEKGYAHKSKMSRRASSVIHDDGDFLRCINALSIVHTDEDHDISALKSDKLKHQLYATTGELERPLRNTPSKHLHI